jgi:hypothetical protein
MVKKSGKSTTSSKKGGEKAKKTKRSIWCDERVLERSTTYGSKKQTLSTS